MKSLYWATGAFLFVALTFVSLSIDAYDMEAVDTPLMDAVSVKPYEPVLPSAKEVEVAVRWDKTNTAEFLGKPTHTPSPTMTPTKAVK